MKPHIKDRLWTQLSELPQHDLGNAASNRIRARCLAALAGPPSRAAAWWRSVERVWTDVLELPMAGLVMAACFSWAIQGMASPPRRDERGAKAEFASSRTSVEAAGTFQLGAHLEAIGRRVPHSKRAFNPGRRTGGAI